MDTPPESVAPEQFHYFLYRDQRTVLTIDHVYGSCQCPRHETKSIRSAVKCIPVTQNRYPSGRFIHFAPWRECTPFRVTSTHSDNSQNPMYPLLRHTRKRIYEHTTLQRYFLVLGIVLLFLVRIPSAMSAPYPRDNPDSSTSCSSPSKWVCPCGEDSRTDPDYDSLVVFDDALINNIILQAEVSLEIGLGFKERYVNQSFGVDYNKHHKDWQKNHFDWLPSRDDLPKQLGEDIASSHLRNLGNSDERKKSNDASETEKFDKALDTTLKDVYKFLQMIAVGLEQVVHDQFEYDGDFKMEFQNANTNLIVLLCEVRFAMEERKLSTKDDVSRSIMQEDVRFLPDVSHRNLRDWLIFREYMNVLEYVIAVFKYIKTEYEKIRRSQKNEESRG